MRIYLKLSTNRKVIPFNYQHLLTGVVQKWIGKNNNAHGKRSLFSFSWLQNTRTVNGGLNISQDSYFFISGYDESLIKKMLKGILMDPTMFHGISVMDVQIRDTPMFGTEETFYLSSPILLRKRVEDRVLHITYKDDDFDRLLTANLRTKLSLANLPYEGAEAVRDRMYPAPKTKLIDYKGIENKTSLVPVVLRGTPEQIAFGWTVGLGESTGIGFGALK